MWSQALLFRREISFSSRFFFNIPEISKTDKILVQLYGFYVIVERNYSNKYSRLKFSNRNTRKWCELDSELTIKTLERRRLRVFLLWTSECLIRRYKRFTQWMLVYFTCYTSNIVHADPISIDTVLSYTNHFQNLVGGGRGFEVKEVSYNYSLIKGNV